MSQPPIAMVTQHTAHFTCSMVVINYKGFTTSANYAFLNTSLYIHQKFI